MGKALASVARLFAAFFALAFMFTTTLVVSAFIARYQLLRPEPYKQALWRANAYERAPIVLAEIISVSILPSAGQGGLFPSLTQADYEILLRHLLPQEWLRSQVEGVVDQWFASARRPDGAGAITVSLTEFKQRLSGEAGAQALLEIVQRRQACSEGDLASFTCGFGLDGSISCRPPASRLALCSAAANAVFTAAAAALPEQISLSGLLQTASGVTQPIRAYFEPYLAVLYLLTDYGWLVPPLFLFLLTIFGVRSWRGFFHWWGMPFLGVATLLILMALFTWLIPTWFVNNLVAQLAATAPRLAQLIVDIVAVLGRQIAILMTVAGVGAGTLGVVFILFSFLVPGPRPRYWEMY